MPSFLLEEAEGNAGKTIGKAYADGEVRAATAERPKRYDERKSAEEGLRQQKGRRQQQRPDSEGRKKSNGDSRKYGPEQCRTGVASESGGVSEQASVLPAGVRRDADGD